jgi:hypothetical protein
MMIQFADSNQEFLDCRGQGRTVHMAAEGGVHAVLEEQRLVHLPEALVLLQQESSGVQQCLCAAGLCWI